MVRLPHLMRSLVRLFQVEIWRPQYRGDRSRRGRFFALLRVLSISVTRVGDTRVPSRAAALSFSSLLGLGPLIAISVLVAGFVLDQKDPNLAVNTLNQLIRFVAPQISEYEQLQSATSRREERSDILTATTLNVPPAEPAVATPASADESNIPVNPELVALIDGFVAGSRSGTVGAIGAITLILIVLQLFTSIETAFNEIWGVHRGRSWIMRVVFYWTVLTLGAVIFFAAVTGLSAGAFFNAFEERVPFGTEFVALFRLLLPAGSFIILVAVLTIFYRAIPNARVWWKAAFIGALVVALLLVLNNFLAFLYMRRVMLNQSLYGSLGILPVMMFGLYIFWFFVLCGGLVSYGVQNVDFRNSQAAWKNLAESAREQLSLIILLTVSRRFHDCRPPCSVTDLGTMLEVPTEVLNESLARLVAMKLLTPIPPAEGEAATDLRYLPARPLNRITLGDFKTLDDDLGKEAGTPVPSHTDPIVERYVIETGQLTHGEFFQKTIEELLAEHPVDLSRQGASKRA